MDFRDYREALGIGFNNADKKQVFYNRLQVIFHTNGISFTNAHEAEFCYATGIPIDSASRFSGAEKVWAYIEKFKSFKEILAALVAFANTYDNSLIMMQERQCFISSLKNALTDSGILFDVIEDADGIFIFPKGAKELDDNLVSEPLQWLTQYPKARNAWIKALKAYAEATDKNASDCADLFRKALEQFFKEFFHFRKALEKSQPQYGAFMKNSGIPAELSNTFEKVLDLYTKYMNEYAKHNDGTAKVALEYIMYQTGSLIRFLITLKQEEMNHAD